MKITTVRVLADRFDETVAFYRDSLGISIRADAGVYVAFDAGGFELGVYRRELMVEVVPSIPAQPAGTGDGLLINIEVEDLEGTIRALQARGLVFETAAQDQPAWGMRIVHLRDPEGNLVELYERLKGGDEA